MQSCISRASRRSQPSFPGDPPYAFCCNYLVRRFIWARFFAVAREFGTRAADSVLDPFSGVDRACDSPGHDSSRYDSSGYDSSPGYDSSIRDRAVVKYLDDDSDGRSDADRACASGIDTAAYRQGSADREGCEGKSGCRKEDGFAAFAGRGA